MNTIAEIQKQIMELKKEKDFCILAHCYQSQEILEVADIVGDSYALSKKAVEVPQQNVLMCGVRFMAETTKILSPQKTVYLSNSSAGCPMAEQLDYDMLSQLKEMYPGYTVVAYINTTAKLKTLCDVCVTSSSAIKIISNIENKDILFIPDCNLGDYIKKQLPDKNIKLVHGGCPTHVRMSVKDVKRARAAHPEALLLVHPECLSQHESNDTGRCVTRIERHRRRGDRFRRGNAPAGKAQHRRNGTPWIVIGKTYNCVQVLYINTFLRFPL